MLDAAWSGLVFAKAINHKKYGRYLHRACNTDFDWATNNQYSRFYV